MTLGQTDFLPETKLSWTAAVVLKEDIRILKERFNQTEGEFTDHVWVRLSGL